MIKADMEGKNITLNDFLIYMRNITNIDGMDKVFVIKSIYFFIFLKNLYFFFEKILINYLLIEIIL